ncbi:hypothetical protein BC827DRAFT_1158930 [Russula dissimulans]|nr:hypothetical protein BC827DRAFT_1158930 [Russula dissimulans]
MLHVASVDNVAPNKGNGRSFNSRGRAPGKVEQETCLVRMQRVTYTWLSLSITSRECWRCDEYGYGGRETTREAGNYSKGEGKGGQRHIATRKSETPITPLVTDSGSPLSVPESQLQFPRHSHARNIVSLAQFELAMPSALFHACSLSRCQENKAALGSDNQQRGQRSSPEHSIPCQYTVIMSHDGLVCLVEHLGMLQKPISTLNDFLGLKRIHKCRVGGMKMGVRLQAAYCSALNDEPASQCHILSLRLGQEV